MNNISYPFTKITNTAIITKLAIEICCAESNSEKVKEAYNKFLPLDRPKPRLKVTVVVKTP